MKKLEDIANISSGGTPSRSKSEYWKGNIPWVSTSLIDFNMIYDTEEKITEEGLLNSSAKICPRGSLLMAMYGQGKTRGKVAVLGIDASINQACASIQTNQTILDPLFLFQNLAKRYSEIRALSNQGGQENLSGTIIKSISVPYPSLIEQKKISCFLSLIDQHIETQNKIIEELKLLKSTIRNKIFEKIRKSAYPKAEIRYLLEYEQPTKYIIENADYAENPTLIPVLTANKAFVLGYTNEQYGVYDKGECIIFDDFTMDMKYVDFSFKVKSSAIKILTPKPEINLRYMFEYLSFLSLSSNEHKRHYISEVENKIVSIPSVDEQNSMARLLIAFDRKIEAESSLCILLGRQKKYLFQEMFI